MGSTVKRQIEQSVAAERERCARAAAGFDDWVYEGRKVDGYSKGTYMMIDGPKSAEAIAARIRAEPVAS